MAAKQAAKKRKIRPKVQDNRAAKPEDRCGCSALLGSSASHILSEREIKALDMMRKARAEATGIKAQILVFRRILEKDSLAKRRKSLERLQIAEEFWEQDMAEELLSCCERLYQLRNQWDHWDEERMAAAEERMRILGHIQ